MKIASEAAHCREDGYTIAELGTTKCAGGHHAQIR